jgi:hypothetical protein
MPRSAAVAGGAGTSRLGEAALAEYHYVARDLRNTAVLVVIMAVLLAASVIVINLVRATPQ